MGISKNGKPRGLGVWFLLFCLSETLLQSLGALPEQAALHRGPKFLPAFPLEQRPSLAFKMPGRPQLCSQPLLAAARGSPRRRRALTQPQSGCSKSDLGSARPEPAWSHRGSTAALEPPASGAGGLARLGPGAHRTRLAR